MAQTFFFYDLETSGLDARNDRIMQFAGQRTDLSFNPIGDPVNELVALNDDTIPSPEALLVTGITPQKTQEEGWSEADFARKVVGEWFTPDTIVVGFNNIRFDDEFIRHLLWRNFQDPYEWSWKDGRSRWDILDVVRMTRALRPDGINWPVDEYGEPTNRLELITKENGISHENAHDALADVQALIDVAKLISYKQPQLFKYLLDMRDKKAVQKLINLDDKKPFVYSSGRYAKEFQKTTVAFPLTSAPNGNVLVYDLRHDPEDFMKLGQKELAKKMFATWEERKAEGFVPLPIKQFQYNKCPAVAPIGVLEQEDGWDKIGLSLDRVEKNIQKLLSDESFAERVRSVFESRPEYKKATDPEGQLYDSFVPNEDRIRIEVVRNADANKLADFNPDFIDERLPELLLHYKARSYPRSLSQAELKRWESWRSDRLKKQFESTLKSFARLEKVNLTDNQQFTLSELKLWIEGVMPESI